MKTSACGINCNECAFFNKECKGCFEVSGKTFWASDINEKGICPLFDCSINKKGYKDCGQCADLPCKIFKEMKDPNISDVEHMESIEKRVYNLRRK